MHGSKVPDSAQPAARQTELGKSADAFARAGTPQTFDYSLPTLVRQLQAMTNAGWLTSVAEPSGKLR